LAASFPRCSRQIALAWTMPCPPTCEASARDSSTS